MQYVSLANITGEWSYYVAILGAYMPKAYEAMRDKFIKEGASSAAAKAKAARIYNSTHKKRPVTNKKD
jgi:hypothetical protein